MPSTGAPEAAFIMLGLAISCGIGYWCMNVFRTRGRSAAAGFALGFLLSFFFPLIGALIALVISYGRSGPGEQWAASTLPATPPRLIATFGPATGWVGRTITYDGRGFCIEGIGQVTAKGLLSYDEQSLVEWAHEGMREWVMDIERTETLNRRLVL
jgi:hypothetical protein